MLRFIARPYNATRSHARTQELELKNDADFDGRGGDGADKVCRGGRVSQASSPAE
jgi:hypothetical protein